MKTYFKLLAIIFFTTIFLCNIYPQKILNHLIEVQIETENHFLSGKDVISIGKCKKDLLLPIGKILKVNGLKINGKLRNIEIVEKEGKNFLRIPSYLLFSGGKIEISFSGIFNDLPKNARFSQEFINLDTSGYIKNNFVYLPPDGYWYPHFENELSPFRIKILTKDNLTFVTGGIFLGKKSSGLYTSYTYLESHPVEPIFLIGGNFKMEKDRYENINLYTYFFPEDNFLTWNYLSAIKKYVKMYSELIGKYPFGKFAVVENQLPTGYGMPSFTLLGKDVLRLPFIVHTSLGHEVLHNWWGNSVFVNYNEGNWCEGLTSYMADHYYKELKGKKHAINYRRQLLVNYMAYVKRENEISLSQFVERHNPAQRAIGYGKSLMVFHMLRKLVGDEVFYESLKNFYSEMIWKKASWLDIERIFEDTWEKMHEEKLKEYQEENKKIPEFEKNLDTSLDWFFTQWIYRKGAPKINLKLNMVFQVGKNNYLISFTLSQDDPIYQLLIPVEIITEKGKEYRRLTLKEKEHEYQIILKEKPIKLIVDPDYDIFRKLYPEEIPPSIATILGKNSIYVYFSQEFKNKKTYLEILKSNFPKKDFFTLNSIEDAISKISEGKIVIFFQNSSENLNGKIKEISQQEVDIKDGNLLLKGRPYPIMGNKKAVVIFKSKLSNNVPLCIFVDDGNEISFERVVGKIIHYGKYGYLIFEGEKNSLKGEWGTINSPLIIDLK